ncbi:terminal uridylyltransferase 4-like, partial [Camellia sinensis]|uniref:terminal uridylyltransferase 4-like n=1 Tax=Camellia sinensis TaxID=4442 RepID=UPI0010359004
MLAMRQNKEEAISAPPVTQRVGRPFKRQKGFNPQQFQRAQSGFTFPVPSLGSGKGKRRDVTCFKCGQLGHKSPTCPQRGGGQRAVSSSTRSQSQSQGRGQPLACYQCGQAGHLKRFCPQLCGTPGASGSRQTQSHQPTQSVPTSRANQGASSALSVQQSYAPRGEQVDQRPTGRVYAVTVPDLVPAPSVVRGTFLFCNSVTNVLIDTSASHSFISSTFASVLG